MEDKNTYIPGVCNIGPEEIKKRKQVGWMGLTATGVLWSLLVGFDTPAIWRLLLFIPSTISASGFLQAYMHFCAAFGIKGVYNIIKPAGQTDTVLQKEMRTKDRRKALKIILYSSLIGLATTAVAYSI